MRCSGFFALLLILPLTGCSDELSDELLDMGFVEESVPGVGSDKWHTANRSFPSFFVESDNGLTIRESTAEEDDRQRVIFEDGSVKYIGIDRGEWGGGLFLNEWDEDAKPLLVGNIQSLVPVGRDLYVIGGLAHLMSSEGSVYVIREYSQPKEPELLVELPDAPAAIRVDQDENGSARITIVGFQSLMELTPGAGLTVIEKDAFWASLYPSSVVKHRDHYIIGIRSGVAVVSPGKFGMRIRYFIPR